MSDTDSKVAVFSIINHSSYCSLMVLIYNLSGLTLKKCKFNNSNSRNNLVSGLSSGCGHLTIQISILKQ